MWDKSSSFEKLMDFYETKTQLESTQSHQQHKPAQGYCIFSIKECRQCCRWKS